MSSTRVERPWGWFVQFTHDEPSTVKLLYVRKGEETSLQYHTHRQEFWKIVQGNPEITIGDVKHHPHPGEEFVVEPLIQHEIAAPVDDCVILEISKGSFEESDIVRISDKYNRAS